ncbi:hypothetical protein ADK70_29850 [Streptomyces rimosus subsp. pseudoverticillatus]|nr:hypothetical protein ADK70_29850 [Streptomyces rimosus subsp. pseudoverticillatus]
MRRACRFGVRLPSLHDGIAFAARISVMEMSEPPYPQPVEETAAQIRQVLRKAAIEFARTCDPADLASAHDALGVHLGRQRSLPSSPPVVLNAALALDLLPDDRSAVAALLAAQRKQTVADVLRRRKTEALARELTDPAAVLARWIEQDHADWGTALSDTAARDIAQSFAQYRPAHERTAEFAALELIRDFLDSFSDPSQKQMLYALLAGGMHHANRPEHAAKAAALLDGGTPPAPDGEVSTSALRWLLSPRTSWLAWRLT